MLVLTRAIFGISSWRVNLSYTSTTHAAAILAYLKVVTCVLVTSGAVCNFHIPHSYRVASMDVNFVCYCLQMGGIYALLVLAEMIQLLAIWNWPNEKFPSNYMRATHDFLVAAVRIAPFAYKYLTVPIAFPKLRTGNGSLPNHASCNRIRWVSFAQQSYHKWRRFVGVVSLWHEGNIA
jgi:hypothetical protein